MQKSHSSIETHANFDTSQPHVGRSLSFCKKITQVIGA